MFAKVWATYKKYEHDIKVPEDQQTDPEFSASEWKMTFQVQEPIDGDFEPDSQDEEDEEMPLVTADVSVTCKSVDIEEGNDIPKKVYLNFKMKSGSQLVFRNFIKQAF